MGDVASWADEVVRTLEYKNTAPWHYLNVPLGLDYSAFENAVKSQDKDNVYSALLKNEEVFTAVGSTYEQRTDALKFIIHLVGDLHQPMHISRAEDKGGNTIQVKFDGKGTNLHSLWDSKLINKEGLSSEQMAHDYDKASRKQIKQWQSEEVMKWLYESYQISSKLYSEIEANNKLDDGYYNTHIPIVHERIEMAGIRLAGLLNELCKSLDFKPDVYLNGSIESTTEPIVNIRIADVNDYVGKNVNVGGIVYGSKDLGSMVLVNVGAPYPNQLLTLVLKGKALALISKIDTKSLTVTGKVVLYKGKPEIVVTDPAQVSNIH